MPSTKSAYADLLLDWEGLLDACGANEALLPGMDVAGVPLAKALQGLRELLEIQGRLLGTSRQVTELLRQQREEGAESARRLRGFVKSRVGTKSGRLKEFGIAPIPSRPPRKGRKK